jgi:hypothetical protein
MKSFIVMKLLFTILIVFVYSGCKASKTSEAEKKIKGKEVIHIRKFNLNGDGIEDVIHFYKDVARSEDVTPLLYNGVSFYIGDKLFKFDDNIWTFGYDESDYYKISIIQEFFGEWDGYCFIGDNNRNGRDEITVYNISGMDASLKVYEYKENQIIRFLYNSDCGSFELMDIEGSDQKALIVIGTSPGVQNAPKPKVTLYTWNDKANKFDEVDYTEEYWKNKK